MSAYNGEVFIEEQVNSIINQTIPVHLTVRDDGSIDNTISILEKRECITLIKGENMGATESFLSLIELAPDSDYYAFADQDDVWDKNKLEIAVNKLKKYESIPAIYSGNTRLVDSELNYIKSEQLSPKCTLGSAIVKNYATGCTIVFNKILMNSLKSYRPIKIPFHDWWANLVCLSIGGVSIYDFEPHMSYRQHGNNVVSGNENFLKKWRSRFKKFGFPYRRENMARQIVQAYEHKIGETEKEILDCVSVQKTNKNLKTGVLIDDLLFRLCIYMKRM